jgi:hypothetical protein
MSNIKSLFFTLLIFIGAQNICGQTNKFDIGCEGGPSLISLRGNNILKQSNKGTIGFSGGLFFQYNFKKVISIRTNIAYERKGYASTANLTDANGKVLSEINYNAIFDYATCPILLRATFGHRIKYFVNAGPYFGFLIKQTFVMKGANYPTTTYDNTSQDKRLDTGISVGLGMIIPIKTQFAISFELRNNLGLYNVSAVSVANNGSIKTNSTNLNFGFAYKIGQRSSNAK